MRWPLRNQIMLPLVAVAILSIATVGGIHAWLAARHTRQRIENQVRGVAHVLTESRIPLTDSVLRQMRRLSGAELVLTDGTGRLLATSLRRQPATQLPVARAVTEPNEMALKRTISMAGGEYFHAAIRLSLQSSVKEERILQILFPVDDYRAALRAAIIPPIVVGLASLAAVAVVAHLVAGRIGRATARVGAGLQRIAGGDFAAAEPPARNDEIRDLALAMNQTARRLASYEQQVRHAEQARTLAKLGAGLAHEMRNAATGCLMAIDLHAEECDACEKEESLGVAKRQLRLMESQLQRFLKSGKGLAVSRNERVDLGMLIDELLPLVRPTARHANVQLDWDRPAEELIINADSEAMSQIVLNLAINAIEAVQMSGDDEQASRRVVLALGRGDDTHVRLTVSDTGLGPAGPLADSLFEPFTSNKPEGIGLGLATARQVVEAHGGTIHWQRRDEMTEFCVLLPLCERGLVGV